MKRLLLATTLLIPLAAQAADNGLVVTIGSGTTLRSKDIGAGVQAPSAILVDQTGQFPGAFTNYGTSPGAVIVPAVNAFVTNTVAVSGTVAISGISGTVSLPTGASTSALQPSNAGIASTTSGQTGNLAMGATTTAAPTYVTGQTNPLSLDTSGALRVNVTAGGAAGGTSSNFGSAFPTPGTAVGMSDGTNMVAMRSTAYGTTPTALNALAVNAFVTNTNANGSASSANSSPVVIANDQAAVSVKTTVAASGGATPTGNIAANNTTAVVVKASAGTLYGVQLSGIGSVPAYVKIYNATSATCGSGTPVKRLMIPAATTAANGAGSNITFGPQGVAFGTGITYCITTGITDADTTAPAASTYLVNLDWN